MSVAFEVQPNLDQLEDAIALFEFIGGNSANAVRVAINKTGPKIRTISNREIRNQVRLKASYVNQNLKFTKATNQRLSGAIRTPTRGILMSRYSTDTKISGEKVSWIKPPPVPPRGIKVKIKPNRPPKLVSGDEETVGKPWYLVLRGTGGRVGIAARRATPGPRGGKVKVFHSPSLSQVFEDVKDDVSPEAGEEYTRQLADAMRFLLNKQQPR
jgi:hypothetical protein